MKGVILDVAPINSYGVNLDALTNIAELSIFDETPESLFFERTHDVDFILTNKITLDEQRLSALLKLKYIGVLATGFDNVDVSYAKSRGIVVTNIPSYATMPTAQHVFALLLDYYNQVALHAASVKKGEWSARTFSYFLSPIEELSHKTLGLIGFGRIAKQVARIAQSFDMNVLVHTRSKQAFKGVSFVELDELLTQSDIVSLHCPLNEQTREIIGTSALSLMRQNAILVNTGRGGLVDEKALFLALEQQRIRHALLDVLTIEPMEVDNPLLRLPNVTITPHTAWGSVEARARMVQIASDNLRGFFNRKPLNVVST